MAQSAAVQALALPEILENIMGNLDIRQLFVLQRVNSTFQSTFNKSTSIRQIMFLQCSNNRTKSMNPIFTNPDLYVEYSALKGSPSFPFYKSMHNILYVGDDASNYTYKLLPSALRMVKRYRSGSWRGMRICNHSDVQMFELGSAHTTFKDFLEEVAQLGGDSTTGELVNKIVAWQRLGSKFCPPM